MPLLEQLDPGLCSGFGEDFGRSGDLTVIAPYQIEQTLRRRFPFLIELRNVPFRQQEQIVFYLGERLPRFASAAMDARGNGQFLGPDPYFDDLFCLAADRRYVSCEQIVETFDGPPQTLLLNRMMVDGVVEAPGGAGFTSCVPDYPRDEKLQREYADAAGDLEKWPDFYERFLG